MDEAEKPLWCTDLDPKQGFQVRQRNISFHLNLLRLFEIIDSTVEFIPRSTSFSTQATTHSCSAAVTLTYYFTTQ